MCKNVLNIDKLSLVGLKQPDKYKENFDVSSEGPSSKLSLYFSGSCIPTKESLFILLAQTTVQDYTKYWYYTDACQLAEMLTH